MQPYLEWKVVKKTLFPHAVIVDNLIVPLVIQADTLERIGKWCGDLSI